MHSLPYCFQDARDKKRKLFTTKSYALRSLSINANVQGCNYSITRCIFTHFCNMQCMIQRAITTQEIQPYKNLILLLVYNALLP